MTIVERCAMNVDPAAVERDRRERAARATADRIAVLRRIVFRNAAHDRDVEALTDEAGAARLLTAAHNNANGFLVLGILRVAVDNRWNQVVQAGVRHFGDHPVSDRIQELWELTTGRSAV
jgi:hypothetical protein